MIDYKDFVIPDFYWDYFVKEKRSLFINSYLRENNTLPSEDMIKNFIIDNKERGDFKRLLYSKYYISDIIPETPMLPDVPNEDINPEDIIETIIIYNDGTPIFNLFWLKILKQIKTDFFNSKAKNKRLLILDQDEYFVNISEVIYNGTLKERTFKNFDKSSNDNMWITILGEIKEYIPSLTYSFYYFGGDIDNSYSTMNGKENNNMNNINEIKGGLEYNNMKLNCIIFDANHGVQIATCNILKDHVRYIIGIPHEAPGTAFTNYMDLFKDNEDIINLKNFCNINFTTQKDSNQPISLSIIDCSKIENFLISVEELFKDEEQKDIDFSQIQNFNPKYPVYDIIDYIEHVFDNEDKILNIKEKIKDVVIEIYKSDTYYSAYNHSRNSISVFCGLTTNFDDEEEKIINFRLGIGMPGIGYSKENSALIDEIDFYYTEDGFTKFKFINYNDVNLILTNITNGNKIYIDKICTNYNIPIGKYIIEGYVGKVNLSENKFLTLDVFDSIIVDELRNVHYIQNTCNDILFISENNFKIKSGDSIDYTTWDEINVNKLDDIFYCIVPQNLSYYINDKFLIEANTYTEVVLRVIKIENDNYL